MDGWDYSERERTEEKQLWVEFHLHDTVSSLGFLLPLYPLLFSETNT
jgi:hypothetical protein